jgi:radical SAM superfamily enzyme YgiQ (UPF0313 family)
MKRILLVRPPFPNSTRCNYPPFGLLNIASRLGTSDVKILDMANGDKLENLQPMNYSVVAISAFSSQLKYCNDIAKYVANNNTKFNDVDSGADPSFPTMVDYHGGHTNVIVGGPGVTSDIEYAKKLLPDCDVLFAGDGERFAEHIKQYYWPLGKQMVLDTRSDPFHWETEKIPAWYLIDYRRYARGVGLAVETSRGCPNGCSMCTAQMIHGKAYRARTPEDVLAEIKYLKRFYGAKKFYFTDDNATVLPKRWIELMRLIFQANLGISLHVPEGIQAHNLDLYTLTLMKEAGFKNIFIGVESGNQRVLTNVVGKGNLTLERVEQVVKDCRKINLLVSCFFVVGLVGETLDEAKDTAVFAQKLRDLGAYSCMVRNAIPIPGTELYTLAKSKGYLTVSDEQLADVDFIHSGKHLIKTPEWNPEDIEQIVRSAKAQDAAHILKHYRLHLVKRGIQKLIVNPKVAIDRLQELRHEAFGGSSIAESH